MSGSGELTVVSMAKVKTGELGRRIDVLMRARQMNKSELARRAGVTDGHIGRIIRGATMPGFHIGVAIARALNVTAEALMDLKLPIHKLVELSDREGPEGPPTLPGIKQELMEHLSETLRLEGSHVIAAYAQGAEGQFCTIIKDGEEVHHNEDRRRLAPTDRRRLPGAA